MMKEFLLGSAVAVCLAGQASALTMTLLQDHRSLEASASAGFDNRFEEDFPNPDFSNFNSDISASASEFGLPCDVEGVVDTHNFGASSFGTAQQTSQVSGDTISFSGSAFARGNHGVPDLTLAEADNAAIIGGFGSFSAYGESVFEILFSIDEAAAYDLSAFISAGAELARGPIENDVINFAEMTLFNEVADEAVFEFEVSDDEMDINESGVIGPGTYRFTASAYAEVFGEGLEEADSAGVTGQLLQLDGYETNARYSGRGLVLTPIDHRSPSR